ncbi:hypothetical protein PR048_002974 [Dryococelus australis]|uniref:Uncharacterized protein n=1 Tax=Dryococelus australis TaxID=614101 RepID=A0ABQ9IN89_9NEOP|nr:hypothetical protein PR048_002974 [Dryococelus australis]
MRKAREEWETREKIKEDGRNMKKSQGIEQQTVPGKDGSFISVPAPCGQANIPASLVTGIESRRLRVPLPLIGAPPVIWQQNALIEMTCIASCPATSHRPPTRLLPSVTYCTKLKLGSQPSVSFFVHQLKTTYNNPSSVNSSARQNFVCDRRSFLSLSELNTVSETPPTQSFTCGLQKRFRITIGSELLFTGVSELRTLCLPTTEIVGGGWGEIEILRADKGEVSGILRHDSTCENPGELLRRESNPSPPRWEASSMATTSPRPLSTGAPCHTCSIQGPIGLQLASPCTKKIGPAVSPHFVQDVSALAHNSVQEILVQGRHLAQDWYSSCIVTQLRTKVQFSECFNLGHRLTWDKAAWDSAVTSEEPVVCRESYGEQCQCHDGGDSRERKSHGGARHFSYVSERCEKSRKIKFFTTLANHLHTCMHTRSPGFSHGTFPYDTIHTVRKVVPDIPCGICTPPVPSALLDVQLDTEDWRGERQAALLARSSRSARTHTHTGEGPSLQESGQPRTCCGLSFPLSFKLAPSQVGWLFRDRLSPCTSDSSLTASYEKQLSTNGVCTTYSFKGVVARGILAISDYFTNIRYQTS